MVRLEGWLSRLGEERAPIRAALVRAFETILLLQLAVEHWRLPLEHGPAREPALTLLAACASVLGAAGLALGRRRAVFALLALVQLGVVWEQFPRTGNHKYLELFLLVILALLDPRREDEQALLLGSLRWMIVVVFFYAGLQKAVHGYYFRGDLLAFYFGLDTFRHALEPFLPRAEVLRIEGLTRQVGGGPFGSGNPQLVLMSNAVWIGEIVLAALYLLRRTRPIAVAGSLGLVAAIELGAHEFYFGALYLNGVLLFLPRAANRWLIPLFGAFYAWLLAMGLGVLPRIEFY
jgi:hypothetical protein